MYSIEILLTLNGSYSNTSLSWLFHPNFTTKHKVMNLKVSLSMVVGIDKEIYGFPKNAPR